MQIRILATGRSPDYYHIAGEVITAYHGNASEVYDLTGFPEGASFQGADPVDGVPALRHVERTDGVLKVALCQQVGPGHWAESDWFDASQYDPDAVHVALDSNKPFAGLAWAKTRQGKEYV